MKNKKVLVLGGSHRDIPIILAIKRLGMKAFTMGNKDYYLGHSYADKFFLIDFNNKEMIKEIVNNENIDFIIPGSGEEAYIRTVEISHELGIGNFDSLKVARLIHDKWEFKKFCLKNNISVPNAMKYKNISSLNGLNYPLIIKPTNLSGGNGVNIVHSKAEAIKAIALAQKISNEIIIEDLIVGDLFAYSVLIQEKEVVYEFCARDISYLNPYLVTTSFAKKIEDHTLANLRNEVNSICKMLQLTDGMFHLQVIVNENTHYIIDVTRRIPGDLFPYLIEYSDKTEYSINTVKAYLGMPIDKLEPNKGKFYIRHCVMATRNGLLKSLYVDKKIIDKIKYKLEIINSGSEINNFLRDQIAILIIETEDYDYSIIENINSLIYPVVE